MPETLEKKLIFKDNREMVAVLGKNDEYLKLMDDPECRIIPRGNELLLTGTEDVYKRQELDRQCLPLPRQKGCGREWHLAVWCRKGRSNRPACRKSRRHRH